MDADLSGAGQQGKGDQIRVRLVPELRGRVLAGEALPLARVQDTLYRLGRAYPTHWGADGHGGHCLTRAEWLGTDGSVLAVSDYEKREKFLVHVGRYRAPAIAAH